MINGFNFYSDTLFFMVKMCNVAKSSAHFSLNHTMAQLIFNTLGSIKDIHILENKTVRVTV